MDFAFILTVIISAVAVYFFVKLIVNPLLRVIAGILVFLILIYILQRLFNFDLNGTFGPLIKYADPDKWGINFNELIKKITDYIKSFLSQ